MNRAARPLFAVLALVAIHAALVPLVPGAPSVGPDWLYCLVIAVVARRPGVAPIWLVLAAGMVADLLLARPPGLGALGLLLAAETVRGRMRVRRGRTFLVEWAIAVAVFVAMIAGIALALRISLAPMPHLPSLGWHMLATALAYPLVVLGLVRGLGLKARAGHWEQVR